MSRVHADVVVLGSGFGGSLLSLILTQMGKRVALIDKASHPRFAIGESSTPLADFVLSDLSQRYGLTSVLPLSSFGTWQTTHPHLRCGLKRGFTYFGHEPEQPFQTNGNNANQLLVAASSNDVDSDTHWHRQDVDHFLFDEARQANVECFESTTVTDFEGGADGWKLEVESPTGRLQVDAGFIVDATGAARVLLRHLGVVEDTCRLKTNSRAIYGHFDSVRTFASVLSDQGIDTSPHPYACDNAALHHVLEDGWMWNLRFTNGLVSAGMVIDSNRVPTNDAAADSEWRARLKRYPALVTQFSSARVRSGTGFVGTQRLQRLASQAGGAGWLALPNTVGFIDPLHSTGIAHTLSAVERIADMFAHRNQPTDTQVQSYADAVRCELLFVDELVSGCYAGLPDFRLFTMWCMLYFASAHSCEMRRVAGEPAFVNGFLGAGLPVLRSIAVQQRKALATAIAAGNDAAMDRFQQGFVEAIAPFNSVGLCDPAAKNMYANTAPPRGFGHPGND